MANQSSTQVLKSFYDAVGAHDADRAASFFSPMAEFKIIAFEKTARGPAEIKALFQSWFKAFPDMKLESTSIKGGDDFAFAEIFVDGTHKGPMQTPDGEIKATNRHVRAPACDVVNIKDGKIASLHCYLESGIFLRQLGAKTSTKAA